VVAEKLRHLDQIDAGIERGDGCRRALQPAVAVRENEPPVVMHGPEAVQGLMRRLRQRHETVLVALGVTHMHAPPGRVDVADFDPQPLAQTPAGGG